MTRHFISACLGFALLGLALLLTTASPSAAGYLAPPPAPAAQGGLPAEGWQVCRIGGFQNIPGFGQRQVFDLCNGQGWRVIAFCLDPGRPIPTLGASCSMISADTFWCGAGVQELSLIGILETPPPASPTPTVTATASATVTPTETATPTVTITPSQTVSPSSTPPTAILDTLVAQTLTPTIYIRPRPGGPGNADLLGNLLLAAGLALAGGLTVYANRLESGRRSR